MTTVATIQKEVERLKEKTRIKEPRYIYVKYWRPEGIDETGLDIVKREGDWITIRVKDVT